MQLQNDEHSHKLRAQSQDGEFSHRIAGTVTERRAQLQNDENSTVVRRVTGLRAQSLDGEKLQDGEYSYVMTSTVTE